MEDRGEQEGWRWATGKAAEDGRGDNRSGVAATGSGARKVDARAGRTGIGGVRGRR